ncbi:MAG: hypothetical protein R3E77_15615 [Steroidobacteraceae bacterium]
MSELIGRLSVRRLLQGMVAAEWLLISLGSWFGVQEEAGLPPEMRNFIREQLTRDDWQPVYFLAGGLFVAKFVASVGLMLLQRWARWLYALVFVVTALSMLWLRASLTGPIEAVFEYLATAVSGAVLAMIFIGPAREWFAAEPRGDTK